MSVVSENLSVPHSVPASKGLRWCLDGLRLWRRAPFRLFLLGLAMLLVEFVLQSAIPLAGVVLSKIVVPIIGMGILLGISALSNGDKLPWSSFVAGFRGGRLRPALGLALITGLGAFAFQQSIAWLVYGWPAMDAILLGHAMAHRELITPMFQRVLLTPGVIPAVLLLLAPCLLLFEHRSPWRAAGESIRTAWRHKAPIGVYLLVNVALFLLMTATTWTFAIVFLIVPWSLACSYVIWRDLRTHEPANRRNDA